MNTFVVLAVCVLLAAGLAASLLCAVRALCWRLLSS
jgi:hypothetical protein